jgi:hypothetical protein
LSVGHAKQIGRVLGRLTVLALLKTALALVGKVVWSKRVRWIETSYMPTDENLEKMMSELFLQAFGRSAVPSDNVDADRHKLAHAGYWTMAHLEQVKKTWIERGALELPMGTPRQLTPEQQLHVARTAVSNPVAGVCLFLCFAAGRDISSMTATQLEQEGAQLLYDLAWREIADKAVLFCFKHRRPDYVPNP